MLARSHSRAGIAALTFVSVALGLLWATPAPAFAAATTSSTPSTQGDVTSTTVKCTSPEIITGLRITGATVTTPGAESRTLDEDQATAFMQTWLGYSVFNNPPQERPPAALPVSKLDVATLQGGQPSPMLIFYASDGTDAWVGAPNPIPTPPPDDEKWIRAPKPKDIIAAFAGDRAPDCTGPQTAASTVATTTSTTVGLASKPAGTSGSDTPWALIIVAIAVVVGGGALVAFRSRRVRPA